MAKFATKTTIRTKLRSRADAKDNLEGGLSFYWDDKTTLYMRAACSLVGEPTFYKRIVDDKAEKNFDNALIEDIHKVAATDPEFVLKLANYARHHLYLRSTPLLLAGEASQIKGCKPFLKKWLPSIICRADEPVELFSYVIHRFGRNKATSNNQLKKGVASALEKFNEYEFAKYNRATDIKLKDILRICHPKHRDIYKKIIDGTLATPDTWEVLISDPKSKGFSSKKEAWEYLVESKKLGYMATLRNIRNLIKENVDPKTLDKALNFISDPEAVKRSKQLPFRFLSAYREIDGSKKVSDALEKALEISIDNIPKLKGTTFIAADISGSMDCKLSERSSLSLKDVACLMAAMADKFCDDSYASVFATQFKLVKTNSRSSIIDNAEKFKNSNAGGSTEGHLILRHLLGEKLKVDRIIVFTDMQMYNSYGGDQFADLFIEYKRKINPKVKLYCMNLATYGDVIMPQNEPDVCLISGWSDNVFRFINVFESDKKTAVEEIQKTEPFQINKKENDDKEVDQ